jgi:putative hydrolase of the HAD superfamily
MLSIDASHVHAVTFDVGGTLIEPWPSVGFIYAQIAARHGWDGLSVDRLNRQFASAWGALQTFNHSRAEWAGLVDATFKGVIKDTPSQTFFPELYERFTEPDAWRVFPEVVPTLDALASRGLKLGVISNWDFRLRPLLRKLRLYDYFDAVVVSCNVGFCKPSPVIFQHAAEKLGLPPGAILHVGDSLDMDGRGAKAAGMLNVDLRRGSKQLAQGQIRTLSELQAVLAPRSSTTTHSVN